MPRRHWLTDKGGVVDQVLVFIMPVAMAILRFGMRFDDNPRVRPFLPRDKEHLKECVAICATCFDRGIAKGLIDDQNIAGLWRSQGRVKTGVFGQMRRLQLVHCSLRPIEKSGVVQRLF